MNHLALDGRDACAAIDDRRHLDCHPRVEPEVSWHAERHSLLDASSERHCRSRRHDHAGKANCDVLPIAHVAVHEQTRRGGAWDRDAGDGREECTVSSMRLPPPRGVWVTCAKLTRSRASAPFAGEGASGAEAARQAVRTRSALEVRAGDIFHSLERLRRVPSLVGVGQSEEPSLVEVVLQRGGQQTDEMGGILRNETDV